MQLLFVHWPLTRTFGHVYKKVELDHCSLLGEKHTSSSPYLDSACLFVFRIGPFECTERAFTPPVWDLNLFSFQNISMLILLY